MQGPRASKAAVAASVFAAVAFCQLHEQLAGRHCRGDRGGDGGFANGQRWHGSPECRIQVVIVAAEKLIASSCMQDPAGSGDGEGFINQNIHYLRYLLTKHLNQSLKKLFLQLAPWHIKTVQDNDECVQVQDLQYIVDELSEEIASKEKKSHIPSQQALYAAVSHFQLLFDVKTLTGVYPRMNEVYTKLGEMTNAMRNLREILELDSSAPPSILVSTVRDLCCLFNENVVWQVEQLLGTQDIESIINKLEEHDDFFPVFHALVNDLLHVLEVENLADILPAVQILKWRGQ